MLFLLLRVTVDLLHNVFDRHLFAAKNGYNEAVLLKDLLGRFVRGIAVVRDKSRRRGAGTGTLRDQLPDQSGYEIIRREEGRECCEQRLQSGGGDGEFDLVTAADIVGHVFHPMKHIGLDQYAFARIQNTLLVPHRVLLRADFPTETEAHYVEKQCGSAITSVNHAVWKILTGMGVRPRDNAAQSFEESFAHVTRIGDAEKTGRIADALRMAYDKATVF